MGKDGKAEEPSFFLKTRVRIYPADDFKNAEVCLREESLNLFCTVREAKRKGHGLDFMELGLRSSEKSYQPPQNPKSYYHSRYLAKMGESLGGQDVEGKRTELTIKDSCGVGKLPGPTTEKPSPG